MARLLRPAVADVIGTFVYDKPGSDVIDLREYDKLGRRFAISRICGDLLTDGAT